MPLTLPGDEVRARIVRRDKRFWTAEVVEIVKPSPDRVEPRCRYFGKCGGCAWQHVPYATQWKVKSEGVVHALKRTLGRDVSAGAAVAGDRIPLREFPAENPWNYRNRIQLRGQDGALGFFGRASRSLVPIDRCEIAREELNAALPRFAAELREGKIARSERDGMSKLELDVLPGGEVRAAWNARHAALGFRQVNDAQNDRLRAYVAGKISDGAHLLDLYGGNGNLSLAEAPRLARVDCIDLGVPAEEEQRAPANFRFYRSDASDWLKRRARELERKHEWREGAEVVAVLDPPREGLGDQHHLIAGTLEGFGARTAVLVGCDADSFARDVARFEKRGWKIAELAAFDLFPQTPHVESVAVLKR